eukprot:scaffold459038_cov52-Prasinocladus_malaysianus.AAC.1
MRDSRYISRPEVKVMQAASRRCRRWLVPRPIASSRLSTASSPSSPPDSVEGLQSHELLISSPSSYGSRKGLPAEAESLDPGVCMAAG